MCMIMRMLIMIIMMMRMMMLCNSSCCYQKDDACIFDIPFSSLNHRLCIISIVTSYLDLHSTAPVHNNHHRSIDCIINFVWSFIIIIIIFYHDIIIKNLSLSSLSLYDHCIIIVYHCVIIVLLYYHCMIIVLSLYDHWI